MKTWNVVQGSEDWCRIRAGRPTASQFEKILTPTGKPSKQAEGYMYDLLAELMLGKPLEAPKFAWMERGSSLEEDAADWYCLQKDVEVQKIGFCTNDAETIGASPDRLVGDDGLLEIKSPSPGVHLKYLLFPLRGVEKEYNTQVQGQLYVTGRPWCDVVSYHPELPSVIVRVERDEEYIKLLDEALTAFVVEMELRKADLERLYGPMPQRGAGDPKEFLTEKDVEDIITHYREKNAPTAEPEALTPEVQRDRRILRLKDLRDQAGVAAFGDVLFLHDCQRPQDAAEHKDYLEIEQRLIDIVYANAHS